MFNEGIYDAAVIGGGPAGSTSALHLVRAGLNVCLIEKKIFPRETLCGEFISREATDLLHELGLFEGFLKLCPNPIQSLKFIFKNGKSLNAPLTFTGYGLSRGAFDNFLFTRALEEGVKEIQPAEVKDLRRVNEIFHLSLLGKSLNELKALQVIAAYGRQSPLDRVLNRDFAEMKSRINGVKMHIPEKYAPHFPKDEIHIYTGNGIYCGVNRVDNGKITVCFLEDRSQYFESPKSHLKDLLIQNDSFKNIFTPEIFDVIDSLPVYGTGNIHFGKRKAVEGGVFMAGDTARVIAPLAGDGIAMALQSARLASDAIIKLHRKELSAPEAEMFYRNEYKRLFSGRLRNAFLLQKAVLNPALSFPAYIAGKMFPGILKYLINSTRG
ncbi:MAG: NAD(P)/FAD-dependent oxidoreductase [Acidobacteriota bacterium]